MKKAAPEDLQSAADEMLPEYDFRGGVRGKHARAYREGHTVKVRREDGTTAVQFFTLADGAVLLEPDVREYFPDSQSVNDALRVLITIIPERRRPSKSRKKPQE
jgi:hypothetical protein